MSNLQIRPAPVRKSIVVGVGVERAFTAFASNIGKWWPRSHSIGTTALAGVVMEARQGGRCYEVGSDGSECEWGKVLLWEPPTRFILGWQLDANWKYDPALITEVEVNFTALTTGETRVDLEHRNLERYGESAGRVRDAIDSDGGWMGILKTFGAHAESGT
jgi:Activator of Hsp90 ATPase homolog 1-like protein